jgi:hypothetical protein
MSDYVLFQLSGEFRQSLIDGHLFYVRQARKRLLSQFDDIEADADRAAEERLEQLSHHFDPDRDDPGHFYEAAHEAGIEFYGLLRDMREQTRLSVVAGIFHEWEKQLREWLAREIQHWHHGDNATWTVWSAKFDEIVDLLESFGWKVRSAGYFRTLDGCRHVVNVYKHGKGKTLAKLKQNYPEYLDDPFRGSCRDTKSERRAVSGVLGRNCGVLAGRSTKCLRFPSHGRARLVWESNQMTTRTPAQRLPAQTFPAASRKWSATGRPQRLRR